MLERNIDAYTIKEQLALHKAKAIVLGCGGGGCIMSETLCRTGVGNITIVDFDVFEDSNKNRQLGALDSTIGKPKVDVIAARLKDINPCCNITVIQDKIGIHNYKELLKDKDIILDAVDKACNKYMVGDFIKELGLTYTTGGLGTYHFWCATLKNESVKNIISEDNDEEPTNYPCASSVFIQGALQAQQAINSYLEREQKCLDKVIKTNILTLAMSVEEIQKGKGK